MLFNSTDNYIASNSLKQAVNAAILLEKPLAVRVETRRMGGGFGGKESQGNALAVSCAVAAALTGRACSMRYDRDDDMVITGIETLLAIAAVLAAVRAARGPRLIDRIVALDAVLLLIAGGLAAESARGGREYLLPIVVVVALVAFTGTVLVARFIEWRDT